MSHPEPFPIGPGQESVWDYPRPPRCERTTAHLTISFDGMIIASTTNAFRVLETSHPPTYYLPPDAFVPGVLRPSPHRPSFCEWKGVARYWSIVGTRTAVEHCAWSYGSPTPPYHDIANHLAVYAHLMDHCSVDGETVTPQPGNFYGGWIHSAVVGPFKGVPGSLGW